MKTTSNSEFARRMTLLARPSDAFKPLAQYDRDGDCIEFFAKPDAFYAERVDELVTVYYSQDTDEVIGSLIKGVSAFCRELQGRLPGFMIEIVDGPVRLRHMFQARLWSGSYGKSDIPTMIYQKLIEVSDDAIVEGVDDQFCLA